MLERINDPMVVRFVIVLLVILVVLQLAHFALQLDSDTYVAVPLDGVRIRFQENIGERRLDALVKAVYVDRLKVVPLASKVEAVSIIINTVCASLLLKIRNQS